MIAFDTVFYIWREAQRKAPGIAQGMDVPELSEEKIQEMKRKIK